MVGEWYLLGYSIRENDDNKWRLQQRSLPQWLGDDISLIIVYVGNIDYQKWLYYSIGPLLQWLEDDALQWLVSELLLY